MVARYLSIAALNCSMSQFVMLRIVIGRALKIVGPLIAKELRLMDWMAAGGCWDTLGT